MLKTSKTKGRRPVSKRSDRAESGRYSPDILAATADLLRSIDAQRDDRELMRERRSELEASVREFGRRFGLKSEDVHAAIEAGILRETYDVSRWLIEYEVLTEESRTPPSSRQL